MKLKYNEENDILLFKLNNKNIRDSDSKFGVIIDYDFNGDIVALELLNFSKKLLLFLLGVFFIIIVPTIYFISAIIFG